MVKQLRKQAILSISNKNNQMYVRVQHIHQVSLNSEDKVLFVEWHFMGDTLYPKQHY